MGSIYSVADFFDMVFRRARLIMTIILIGCLLSVGFALMQRHIYSSTVVIQIEQPKVAGQLASSTVDGSAARRLQLIEQKLMARDNLLALIDQFGLFDHMPGMLDSERLFMLRNSIQINGVAAVTEGQSNDGSISVLSITAELNFPDQAQAVAREFADRTRELATEQRRNQSRETLAFLQSREENLKDEIRGVEEALEAFRAENDLSIEGSLEFRRSEIASLNVALLSLDREIIATQLERQQLGSTNARAATVEREAQELTSKLSSLTTQRSLLAQRRERLSTSLETTPEVERRLTDFDRRLSQLREQLLETSAGRVAAEVGYSLENDDRGERFIILEDAQIPEFPVTRSRKTTAIMGAIASAIMGLVIAFLLDLRRPVIRTARQMERETGLLPVVSIPQTPRPKEERRGLFRLWQSRSQSGQRGRAARFARNANLPKG